MKGFRTTSRRLPRLLVALVVAGPALLTFAGPAQAFTPVNGRRYQIKQYESGRRLDVREAGVMWLISVHP